MKLCKVILSSTFLLLLCGSWATSTLAQCDETELNPSDGKTDDEYGHAVALSRNYLAVAAPGDDNSAGSVYLYKKQGTGWVEQTKLTASDRRADTSFGAGLAMDRQHIVVAAPFTDDLGTDSGSVYVYTPTGGNSFLETKLHAADGTAGQWFGWDAVAIEGNRITVGAHGDGGSAGEAYVFHRQDGVWTQEAKLVSEDIHAFDLLGCAVAMGGKRIAVGALGAQLPNGKRVGAVYVFEFQNGKWVQQAKLTKSNPQELDFFGSSVSISEDGTWVAAGAGDIYSGGAFAGYIFHEEGGIWVQEAELSGFAAAAINFPYCAFSDTTYGNAGGVYLYLFDGTNWNLKNLFTPSDGTIFDFYGMGLALDQMTLAAGAPLHKYESGPGAVYTYDPGCEP